MRITQREIWKDIKGFEGLYKISNLGRVKSFTRKKIIIKKPNKIKSGYCYAHLCKNGRKSVQIHRLVAKAFISNPENKPEVNHKDGNKSNNNVKNLEWVTKSENHQHSVKNGFRTSEMYSKLSIKAIKKIRKLYPKFNQYQLADMFDVCQAQISRIIRKENWKLV